MAIISNLHDNPAHRYCLCFIAEETETYGVKPVVQGHKTSRRQTQDLSLDLFISTAQMLSPLFHVAACGITPCVASLWAYCSYEEKIFMKIKNL